MQISTEKENSKLTVTVSGRIDTVTAPELEKYVGKLKLLNINTAVKEIFGMIGFSRIFTIE